MSNHPPVSSPGRRFNAALLWIAAFLITTVSLIYQRVTGPTYPVRGVVELADARVSFELPRSHPGAGDGDIRIAVKDPSAAGTLTYRRYRSHDEWQSVALRRDGEFLVGSIPHQPPAGKVMYRLTLTGPTGQTVPLTDEPVIIRFRGDVPAVVVIAHVTMIFAGMLLAMRAGLGTFRHTDRTRGLALTALLVLALGGLIFGPIMQKYAFGAFWTGWPHGHDLTDNKLVVAVLAWLVAVWRSYRKPPARGWVLGAALVTLTVWFIPHSVLGSELDYTALPPA